MSPDASSRDRSDPLAAFRGQFVPLRAGTIYLAGHSLGRQPGPAADAVNAELARWADDNVRGWSDGWMALGADAASLLEAIIGGAPGTVSVGDSTTVQLFKVATAALAATPDRPDIVSDNGNFPTDLYVLDAVARAHGGKLRLLDAGPGPDEVERALDPAVGLLALSLVDFRSGALLPMQAITDIAHRAGVAVAWDLSHAAGVVQIDLGATGAEFAVGCTYKYLHGGPGAPAFLYVRPDLADGAASPIPGWMGHAEPFRMETGYRPAQGVARFAAGTPQILGLAAARAALTLVASAGMERIRAKSLDLSGWVMSCAEARLGGLGVDVLTVRTGSRGGHVALRHEHAWQVTQSLLADFDLVCDFREPDIIRMGLAPLPLSFAEVDEAVERLRACLESGAYRRHPVDRAHVT